MRAISSRAGVTVGLITHHFGTKAGLIQAVEDDLLDGIANAIAYQESDESVDGVVRKLDQRLLDHIDDNPLVAAYLRRMMLIEGNGAGSDLTERFTRLALRQIQVCDVMGLLRRRANGRPSHAGHARETRPGADTAVRRSDCRAFRPRPAALSAQFAQDSQRMNFPLK